jgi:hypothetical protein
MKKYEERITVNGKNTVVMRGERPVDVDYVSGDTKLLVYDINDPKLQPENFDKPSGTPMTLLKADALRIDLSKRTKEAMNFWHRSCDFHELIFCFQGSIFWETELGNVELQPGQMLLIPKGIAHRSSPGQTGRPNIIMEFKIYSGMIEEIVAGQNMAQKGGEGKGGK